MGLALLELTRRQFTLEAETEQLLSASSGMLSGHLRIASDSPFLVIPLLEVFSRQHPKVKLSMSFGNTATVMHQLIEHKADIGIMPERSTDPRLMTLPMKKDRIICFVSKGHPWSIRHSIELGELKTERMIVRERGSHTQFLIEQELQRQRIVPRQRIEIGSREGMRETVAHGLGVGFIQEGELTDDIRLHPLTIRHSTLQVTEYVSCLKEARDIPIIKAFFDIQRKEFPSR
jgi:DNA-binding transcriptional LysR family regulator